MKRKKKVSKYGVKIIGFRPGPDNTEDSEYVFKSTSNKTRAKKFGYEFPLQIENFDIVDRDLFVEKDYLTKHFKSDYYGTIRSKAIQASIGGMTGMEIVKTLARRLYKCRYMLTYSYLIVKLRKLFE